MNVNIAEKLIKIDYVQLPSRGVGTTEGKIQHTTWRNTTRRMTKAAISKGPYERGLQTPAPRGPHHPEALLKAMGLPKSTKCPISRTGDPNNKHAKGSYPKGWPRQNPSSPASTSSADPRQGRLNPKLTFTGPQIPHQQPCLPSTPTPPQHAGFHVTKTPLLGNC